MTIPVGPGQLYLIDTSAHARVDNPPVCNVIAGLIADRAAATRVTVDLEAGYSGRDVNDIRAIALRRRSLYVVLPISEATAEQARDVQVRMAARGHHGTTACLDRPAPHRHLERRLCRGGDQPAPSRCGPASTASPVIFRHLCRSDRQTCRKITGTRHDRLPWIDVTQSCRTAPGADLGAACPQCEEADLRPFGNGSKWVCPRCHFVLPCCEGGELPAGG